MASTAIKSFNKWVKYCVEQSIQVSSYVESLKEDGAFEENHTNEKLDIPASKLKELEKFLSEKYTRLQESSEALRRVCIFISCKVKTKPRTKNDAKKNGQPKTKTADTGPDDQSNQITSAPEKKNIREEKGQKGKHWVPCNYCFAYGTERPERRKSHMQRCPSGPDGDSVEERNVFIEQSLKDFRARAMNISQHIYVNPRSLEDKLYDKSEVLLMLRQLGHLEIPLGARMRAPAAELGRKNPTHHVVSKSAPNPIADLKDRFRASAPNPIDDLDNSDEAEFNSDQVHVVTVEPMNEDEDENAPAETLPPSKGKSSIVPDEEEQLPYCPDIIGPTPEKECIGEEEEPLHRPTRVRRRILSFSSEEDVNTADVSYRPSVESEEEANTTAPEVKIGKYTPRKRNPPRDPSSPDYGRKVKKGNVAQYEYASGLKQKLQEIGFYDVPAGFLKLPIWKHMESVYFKATGIEGQNKSNHIGNIQRMLWKICNPKVEVSSKMLDRDSILEFYNFLETYEVNHQTIVNYNKSLNHLLKYYLRTTDMINVERPEYDRLLHVQSYCETITAGFSKKAHEQYRQKLLRNPPPPSPKVLSDIVEGARKAAEEELTKIEERLISMTRDGVALINRYLAAEICLRQGHRQGVVMHFYVDQYKASLENPEYQIVDKNTGERVIVVPVHEHKTAKQYSGKIVLRSYLQNFIERYIRNIRLDIVWKTQNKSPNMLLQFDGQPFLKVSQAIVALQLKLGIQKPYTISDARKSVETYAKHLDAGLQKTVATFLCHSEDTRDKVYRHTESKSAVDALVAIESLTRMNTEGEDASCSSEANQVALTGNGDEEPATPRKRKAESFPSPPKSIGKGRVIEHLLTKFGSLAEAKIPKPSELLTFGIKKHKCEKVARDVRYEKLLQINNDVATYLLMKEAKRLKVGIKDVDVSTISKFSVPDNVSKGKKLDQKRLESTMYGLVNYHKSKPDVSHEDLLRRVKTQEWPNLVVREVPEKGTGVFTGELAFNRGEVVCDYHGDDIPAKEGERRLQTYGDYQTDGNYFLFYTNAKGKKRCIDAANPCPCHPNIKTKGRLINHAAGNPNLKSTRLVVNGEEHVFLVAQKFIAPFVELTYDYSVRRAESGEKIAWLSV